MALQKRLNEIVARKAELRKDVQERGKDMTAEEIGKLTKEVDELTAEETQLRGRVELEGKLGQPVEPEQRGGEKSKVQQRAEQFRAKNEMAMPLFLNERALLVSSGKVATPTAVSNEIGELPSAVSSIVDDVYVMDATGTGAWTFPYKKTDAAAVAVTEGQAIGGTGATYDKLTISPTTWGVLDEISNQVKLMTDVAYAQNVQNSAYLALRRFARDKIVDAVLASSLAETRDGIAIDADYLRTVILGFGLDETVGGGTKLYLNRADLYKLGKVRGTSEKKPLYDIKFDAGGNTGTITEGGMSTGFAITNKLTEGTQLYGQPKTVRLLLWGDYQISTDEGGDYFKRNMMGIRALASAGTDLVVPKGMQIIKQAAGGEG